MISIRDLSVVIIAKDEEKNIYRCISNLPEAGEVIIVDNGSKDRTMEIGQYLGTVIYDAGNIHGFSNLRKLGLNKVKNDWVLFVDADEVVSISLRREIESSINADDNVSYIIPRLNLYFGRFLRFGGFHPDHQLRLFKKNMVIISDRLIHESIISNNKTVVLKNPIIHLSYPSLSSYIRKQAFYIPLMVEEMKRNGVRRDFMYRIFRLYIKPCGRFLLRFIIRFGVFDGWQGLFACLFDARIKYLSYREYIKR
jgi:glycosyltransferase involved in cell wall biosynthesis